MTFIDGFRSEWLKKRRSLASWLVVVGGFFTHLIILTARVKNHSVMGEIYAAEDFWVRAWNQAWESMAIFLLPIGIILATGLITQIEYKNNTWKQLHITPQWLTSTFSAKYLVVLAMLVQVFVLFNVGFYLSAAVPAAIFEKISMPNSTFPIDRFVVANFHFFVTSLPVVALQYLLSLRFRNFLVPVGAGLAIWFLGIGLLSWEHSYVFPYNHSTIYFLASSGQLGNRKMPPVDVEVLAVVYFVVFTIASWLLYVTRNEKG